ncbi:MAG: hypothetical protein RBS02_14835 [Steroidobacteraceae bacterium]|jgi:hypothetical protein|nr:hypothetical protein [Steroidobacteraceae bacterium]
MKDRDTMARTVGAAYEEAPFFFVAQRYLWPFWLFQDANRGDRLARAAAYRHNRRMRIHLPVYLLRWLFTGSLAYVSTISFESLAANAIRPITHPYWLLTIASGVAFVASLCMLLVTGYIYLYLSRRQR